LALQPRPAAPTADEIRTWLLAAVGEELQLAPERIDVHQPLTRYGLDSLAAVVIAGELEEWIGRPLPADLLRAHPSIDEVALRLTGEAEYRPAPELVVDYGERSRQQRVLRRVVGWLTRALMQVEVTGLDRLPHSGAFIVATNHLHAFDAAIVFALLPMRIVFYAADKFRRIPGVRWFLKHAGDAIYVARGQSDRVAVLRALEVLRSGGRLAIAPEGGVSRPGLGRGKIGTAYLAVQAGVPVVPIVLYGQEQPFRTWLRLRRVRAHMHVGEPLVFPAGRARMKELETYTDELMGALARMLPPGYRGVYAELD